MSENQLLFYTVPDKALDNLLRAQRIDRDVKYAMETMAVDVTRREDLGPLMEGYTGILDDYDVDLNEAGSNEAADTLTGLEEQSEFVWFTIPAREAKKVAKKVRAVTITEEDVDNYFESADASLADLQGIHAAFLSALEDVDEGQTLVFPIAS